MLYTPGMYVIPSLNVNFCSRILEFQQVINATKIIKFQEAPKYTVVEQMLTWSEAKAYCEARGDKLAEPHSIEKNEQIKAELYIDRQTYMQFWFGLRKVANNQWQYTDGSVLGFSNWGSGREILCASRCLT